MKMNYRCSICGAETGRKTNAYRHLRLVWPVTWNKASSYAKQRTELWKSIELLDSEEYIRELARLRARKNFKSLSHERLEYEISFAIKHMYAAYSLGQISESELQKLLNKLTGFELDFETSEEERFKGMTLRELGLDWPHRLALNCIVCRWCWAYPYHWSMRNSKFSTNMSFRFDRAF